MDRISAEDFKKKYGEVGLQYFSKVQADTSTSQQLDTVGSNAKQDIQNAISGSGKYEGQNPITRGIGATATALNTIPQGIMALAPKPVQDIANTIGSGISTGFKALTDLIGSNKQLQDWTQAHPEATKAIMEFAQATSDTGSIAGNLLGIEGGVKSLVKGSSLLKTGVQNTANAITDTLESVPKIGITSKVSTELPSQIMNRVSRLNPTDYTTFENIAGETPGKYLVRTGNFGAPDKIIANEASKFIESKNSVDTALANLPGVYKPSVLSDIFYGLTQKSESVSGKVVKSSFNTELEHLKSKFEGDGLSMSEINQVKRLYEREIRLGYDKRLNPDKVQQATNIDNSLRDWQVKQAEQLGFKNIGELNKQTQISKFLMDKLGEKVIGQSGLNAVNLSDWVILSGGDPSSISAFLTKKFFSSKTVQAKIAEMLNKEGIQGIIKPDVSVTPENINRTVNPQGNLALPAPTASIVPTTYGNKIQIPKKLQSTIDTAESKNKNIKRYK